MRDLRDIVILEAGGKILINEYLLYRTSLPKEAHTPSQRWIYSFCYSKEEALKSNPEIDCEAYLRPMIDAGSTFLPFEKQNARNFSEGYLIFYSEKDSYWENIISIKKDE